jgi:hypothetical protein
MCFTSKDKGELACARCISKLRRRSFVTWPRLSLSSHIDERGPDRCTACTRSNKIVI